MGRSTQVMARRINDESDRGGFHKMAISMLSSRVRSASLLDDGVAPAWKPSRFCSPRSRLRFAQALALSVMILASAGFGATTAGELPEHDTHEIDYLDELQFSPQPGSSLGRGETVSLNNGNLRVTHPSSPVFPLDGRLQALGLSRSYNSKRVAR